MLKKKQSRFRISCRYTAIFVFSIIFLLISSYFFAISVNAFNYKPSAPSGENKGTIDIEYEYKINTTETDSSWKYDWGDSNYSDWIYVSQNCINVTDKHSWTQPGNYNVRIKYQSKYMEESTWSSPLIVNITNEPIIGGTTSVNYDYLLDDHSTIPVYINEITYYLMDTNSDGEIYIFYNYNTKNSSYIEFQSDGTCNINFDNQVGWDYIYSFVDGSIKEYSTSSSDNEDSSSVGFPWLTVLITIIIAIIIIITILFKTGIIFLYDEEYEAEE